MNQHGSMGQGLFRATPEALQAPDYGRAILGQATAPRRYTGCYNFAARSRPTSYMTS